MRICSTGFARIDLLHLSKLVELMGATYDEYLTPKASILICNDPQSASHDKLRHTTEWGIPAVSADWFWISIQSGQKKPIEPYIVRKQINQSNSSMSKPASKEQPRYHVEKGRDGTSRGSTGSSHKERIDKPVSARNSNTRIMPIIGDGFSKEDDPFEPPKPSVPESRSPSPEKAPENLPSEDQISNQPAPDETTLAAAPSALDTALKGLLQQAQAAKTRKQSENTPTNEEDNYPPRRKRKPLLGRASSHHSKPEATGPSRASSIDTLNDDGLGSAMESADPTRDNSLSRTNSRNDQSLSSIFSGARFDFLAKDLPTQIDGEDEENQEPQMTQLDYEDADAAAMRAEFLREAGKDVGKIKKPDAGSLGQVRELEDIGWGSGRRTRKHIPKLDDE
jgi:DNA replication regulator DPB11